eukprot:scaffold319_cov362-Pavlova_lutheri.AAC.7
MSWTLSLKEQRRNRDIQGSIEKLQEGAQCWFGSTQAGPRPAKLAQSLQWKRWDYRSNPMINASLSRKNKKKGVEMNNSADWVHKPRLVLNSLDRISKLVASVGKGGGIPISCLSNESNPKFA